MCPHDCLIKILVIRFFTLGAIAKVLCHPESDQSSLFDKSPSSPNVNTITHPGDISFQARRKPTLLSHCTWVQNSVLWTVTLLCGCLLAYDPGQCNRLIKMILNVTWSCSHAIRKFNDRAISRALVHQIHTCQKKCKYYGYCMTWYCLNLSSQSCIQDSWCRSPSVAFWSPLLTSDVCKTCNLAQLALTVKLTAQGYSVASVKSVRHFSSYHTMQLHVHSM